MVLCLQWGCKCCVGACKCISTLAEVNIWDCTNCAWWKRLYFLLCSWRCSKARAEYILSEDGRWRLNNPTPRMLTGCCVHEGGWLLLEELEGHLHLRRITHVSYGTEGWTSELPVNSEPGHLPRIPLNQLTGSDLVARWTEIPVVQRLTRDRCVPWPVPRGSLWFRTCSTGFEVFQDLFDEDPCVPGPVR